MISSDNPASLNIKSALLGMEQPEMRGGKFWSARDFDIAEYPGSIIEIVPSHDAEYYVFASTHKSKSNSPALTVHTPGNWGEADLGGSPRTLNWSLPFQLKAAARRMAELAPQLPGWQVSLEADHHGPTLQRPVMFAEIGSTGKEWGDPVAGRIAAEAIVAAIRCKESFPVKVGFGGTHYAPKFGPKIIGDGPAFGHLVSGYAMERDGVDSERVRQAFERNAAKPECAEIDWKGMKGEARSKLVSALEECGIPWEKA